MIGHDPGDPTGVETEARFVQHSLDGGAEPRGRAMARREPQAGTGLYDAPGVVRLVPVGGDDDEWHAELEGGQYGAGRPPS